MTHDPTRRRTAAVRLIDGTTVTVREPEWCAGQHENGRPLADLFHDGPECALRVQTQDGPIDLLHAALTVSPYSASGDERYLAVTVDLGDGPHRFDGDGLFGLADALARHAVALRTLARQLGAIEATEAGR